MRRHLPALGVLAALTILTGCGEQDLYEPPVSPFQIAGRLGLPSEAQDVDILGHYAYVAAGQAGLQVIDISDPYHPRFVLGLDTPKFAEAVTVARTYDPDGTVRDMAFLIEGTEGIIPFDITAVPDSVVDLRQGSSAYNGNAVVVALPEFATDPYALFLADSWRAITGFVSEPDNPGFLDQRVRAVPYGYAEDLAMNDEGTYIYVADDEMGVTVLDATGIFDRRLDVIGNTDTPGRAVGIDVAGSFVYVADDAWGFHVMEIGADGLPALIATLEVPGDCRAVEVYENRAFVAAEDAGLFVIDVSDPRHPISLGNAPTPNAQGVAVGEHGVVCVADNEDGLIVFSGPTTTADFTAPAMVTDLTTQLIDTTAVTLSWTAPGDDGDQGTAQIYHVYQAEAPFADSTLTSATEIARRPVPRAAGTAQSMEATGLTPGTLHYFRMTTVDEAGNEAPLSVTATARMTTPTLSDPSVSPDSGDVTTTFRYQVTYRDPEGDPPAVATVRIDGESHEMDYVGGGVYESGVLYRYETTLGLGSHVYQFAFDDGHGPLVTTAVWDGPKTPADPFDFTMVPVGVGFGITFTMGSPAGELGREVDETEHSVSLTDGFLIADIEVTQGLFAELMDGWNPATIPGDARPVENVTWYDALAFCNALSRLEGYTEAYTISGEVTDAEGHCTAAVVTWNREANGYRLPTEAEWEAACRAATVTALPTGELAVEHCEFDPLLDGLGWYCGNADTGTGPRTHDVRAKDSNSLGLYDMHGNVWEWSWDRYGPYPEGPVTNPSGPEGEAWQQRVRRGGSWYYFARDCRSASRDPYWPGSRDDTLGFRIARNAD